MVPMTNIVSYYLRNILHNILNYHHHKKIDNYDQMFLVAKLLYNYLCPSVRPSGLFSQPLIKIEFQFFFV